MCGRYVYRRIDLRRFGLADVLPAFDEFTERPRFNVAPRQGACFHSDGAIEQAKSGVEAAE
jgi:hypothetical protein